MNARHQKKMSHPLVTKTVALNRYLYDKTQQARRVTKQGCLYKLLAEGMELWHSVCDLVDGMDTGNKAMRQLYRIQQDAVFAGFMEKDDRHALQPEPGVDGKPKARKKHYGFDFHAVAYVDEMCDDLLAEICAYGQNHKPQNKG